jgi:hypothetical protein
LNGALLFVEVDYIICYPIDEATMAKTKPVPLPTFEELNVQFQNIRSVIMEAKAMVDGIDLAVCRLMNRVATAEKQAREGAWGEKKP